jgi:circadian clock protein KaiC
MPEEHASPQSRFATRVPGLDTVLCGGLVRGSMYLVMGRPGTGKTTLASQIAFGHASAGGRVAYLTLLSESHVHMLRNMEAMRFFQPDLIGTKLQYFGGYAALRDGGLAGLLELIQRVLLETQAELLVLDGFGTARAHGTKNIEIRELTAELQVICSMADCTALLLANVDRKDANDPEHSMVDGLIDLFFGERMGHTVRELEVLKLRGSAHLLGRHELHLGSDGLVIHPRLEQRYRGELALHDVTAASAPAGPIETGIVELDRLLDGGIAAGSSTLVLGPTGSGKTTLALQFVAAGAERGEPGLLFGFHETPRALSAAADRSGIPLRAHVQTGLVELGWRLPGEGGIDSLAEMLLESVERRGVRRVAIDGLDGLRESTYEPSRLARFARALLHELERRGATTLLTDDEAALFGAQSAAPLAGLSAIVDNVVVLERGPLDAETRRVLSVLKARSGTPTSSWRELWITSAGVTLAADGESAKEIERVWRGRPGLPNVAPPGDR